MQTCIGKCKFLAGNLRRTRAANSLFAQSILDHDIDIALIQDAYVIRERVPSFPSLWSIISSLTYNAHIIIVKKCNFTLLLRREYYSAITIFTDIGPVNICCAYVPPRGDFDSFVQMFESDFNHYKGSWIVHGDFNAHSPFWHCRNEDVRGEVLLDLTSSLNLFLVNPWDSQPTVEAPCGVGYTDLTWSTHRLESYIKDWQVLETYTASDHRYIYWYLQTGIFNNFLPRLKTKFVKEQYLISSFTKAFSNANLSLPIFCDTTAYSNLLLNIINISMDTAISKCRLKTFSSKITFQWWNSNLLLQRKKLKALRRRLLKSDEINLSRNRLLYQKYSAEYKKNINIAKTKAWREFCSKQKVPFDIQYKLWRGKLNRHLILPPLLRTISSDISCEAIFTHLFPESSLLRTLPFVKEFQCNSNSSITNAITQEEILFALRSITPDKAPGPFGMDAKLIFCIFQAWPKFFVQFYNIIFSTGFIPSYLQISKLILLSKPNKPLNSVKSYRPICLAPYFSKLLDKLILHRLIFYLQNFSPLSNRQFGFLENRNTEQAIHFLITAIKNFKVNYKYTAVIAADISAAFDSIQLRDIEWALRSRGIQDSMVKLIISFISNRHLVFYHPSSIIYLKVIKGVPQGSSLGPILWNLVLESLLNFPLPSNIVLSAYADDICFVVAGNSRKHLETVGNRALSILHNWTTPRNLAVSVDKTKVLLLFKSARLRRSPYFYLNGHKIETVKSHRILGLILDSRLNWIQHALFLKRILHDLAFRLLSFSRNNWGVSGAHIKQWYLMVAERIIVYAAPIWAKTLNSHVIRVLRSIQRSFALRAIKANRHISTDAALQLAGLIPIELVLLKEYVLGTLFRLRLPVNLGDSEYNPNLIELPVSRWFISPAQYKVLTKIVVEDPYPPDNALIYYTDGSKTDSGVGLSFCVFSQGQCIYTWNTKLRHFNTVFQAEAFAIYYALSWHLEHHRQNSFVILSDSQSVIKALIKFKQQDPIIQGIITLFLTFNGSYGHISWIKAHVGIAGNELADYLAKQATLIDFDGILTGIPMPKSYIKANTIRHILKLWQSQWNTSSKGRFTYPFLPAVSQFHFYDNYYLNLFLTNRGPFPSFLFYIGKLDSPYCICNKYGDALHYLFECPLTENFHFIKPSAIFKLQWFKKVLKFKSNISKICTLVKWLLDNETSLQPA